VIQGIGFLTTRFFRDRGFIIDAERMKFCKMESLFCDEKRFLMNALEGGGRVFWDEKRFDGCFGEMGFVFRSI